MAKSLRGERLASCLLVEAADGYRVVMALPEVDPSFTDKQILLVDEREGKPLGDKEGPFRIVIPDEKRMARWVRQVKTLKVVEPGKRKAGVMVKDVAELVDKLKNEAKVI